MQQTEHTSLVQDSNLRGKSIAEQLREGVSPTNLILNLKDRCDLSLLRDELRFNEQLCEKIESMAPRYPAFRPIRGDGNCYYRAVGFSFLERAMKMGEPGKRLLEGFVGRCSEIGGASGANQELEASRELVLDRLGGWISKGEWRWESDGEVVSTFPGDTTLACL